MKKITLFIALLSVGLLLTACSNSKGTASSSSSSSSSQTSSSSSSSSTSESSSSSSSIAASSSDASKPYAALASEMTSFFAKYNAKVYVNADIRVSDGGSDSATCTEIDVATEDSTVIAAVQACQAGNPTSEQISMVQTIKDAIEQYGQQLTGKDDAIQFNPWAGILTSNFTPNFPGHSQNPPIYYTKPVGISTWHFTGVK